MPHTLSIDISNTLVVVEVTGKLTTEDYSAFGPLIEQQIVDHGKLKLLFVMKNFEGWTLGAMWSDIKFDFKHYHDIEKLAIVGETKWQEGMAAFCKPFTSAKIQYFDQTERDEAEVWLLKDE